MIVFRLLIPATAAVMNLLSASAAFGVIVAVFQWGWLKSLVGVTHTGPIPPLAPILMFAVLFGLSTDYEVFLISRIHEEWLKRKENSSAVSHGQAVAGSPPRSRYAVDPEHDDHAPPLEREPQPRERALESADQR